MSSQRYVAIAVAVVQATPPESEDRVPRKRASSRPAEEWFAARTWQRDALDTSELGRLLEESGATVSVVVPALDEEDTVAGVVGMTAALRDRGVVDEVVVVDGGSTDATAQRAAEAGARVVAQQALLPEAGPAHGKGDALWKGLAATDGDLVVFLDADLHEPDPLYVTGLLAPLVVDPELVYVKACYDRPLRLGDRERPAGGGRVTELLARPLLNAFWPQLAGVAQPLSGEYAGRRTALERVPFVCGYGVEIGLLLDLAHEFGPAAIAQVDLGRRVHDHQGLVALGGMAAEILQVAGARLVDDGRLSEPPHATLLQPSRHASGALGLEARDAEVRERPPLASRRNRD